MQKYFLALATDQKKGIIAAFFKFFLWLFSYVYGFFVGLRNILFDIHVFWPRKVKKPVISVGNITMGGAGKTPLVIYIVRALRRKQHKPAVLIRGFMPDSKGERSDEVQLLEEALLGVPILEGKNRYDNAKKTLKQGHVDAFVMDDGFQHRRLKRDLNIVVVDALNPWGNRQMIPRGILREPLRSLKRADVIILTKVDLAQNVLPLKQEIQRIHPQAVVCETMHHPFAVHSLRSKERLEPSFLKGRKVCAISGIGNPDSFDKTLLALEADVHKHFIFEDHHIYTQTDVERIVNYALKNGVIYVITTQKDLPKLKPFIQTFGLKLNLLVLEIQFAFITGEEQFLERVNHLFQH